MTLVLPEALTTYTSPVTALPQTSLETPDPEETEATTEDYTSQTKQPKPIIQPTEISLIIPVADGVSDSTSFVTVVPTAIVEQSGTIPITTVDTTSMRPTRAPKMPHLEKPGSELERPSQLTDHPDIHEEDGSRDPETSGPDATVTQPTKAGVVIVSETGNIESENGASTPTQDAHASTGSEISAGSQTQDAHAGAEEETAAGSQTQEVPATAEGATGIASKTQDASAEGETYSDSQTRNAHANSGPITTGSSGGNGEVSALPTLIVDNTPLIPGGSPITVDGTTYSLASTGTAVIVNGNTVSFTTDAQSHIVPVETMADVSVGGSTDMFTSQALGALSVMPAEPTTNSETAGETGSLREKESNGSSSRSQAVVSTTTMTGGNAGATTTSDGSESAPQSDDSGALNLQTWPITAVVGAIGLLAVAV
jgi:hypothetical protein